MRRQWLSRCRSCRLSPKQLCLLTAFQLRLTSFRCYSIVSQRAKFMKTYQRLLIFGLAALAFTALLSPWAALAWEQFISGRAGWEEFHYPFSRIFDRFFMISGVILFFVFRPLLRIGSLTRLGLTPRIHAAHDLILGAGLALASMAGLVALMSLRG